MPYQHPSLIRRLYPTITDIQNAVVSADLQDERTRDIRPLMAILNRMAIASPRLSGHILTRRTALLSYDFHISEDGAQTDRAAEAATLLRKLVYSILHYSVNVPLFGAALLRLAWNTGPEKTLPILDRAFKPYEVETDGSKVSVIETDTKGSFTRTPIQDEMKQAYIIAIDESTWIGGILRSIMYHELLRNDTIQEWANFNKKLKGLIQAKAPEEEKKDAGNAAANFVNNQFAVTSHDVEFILNELTSSRGADSFSVFKSVLENDIAIAILGQANTAELPAGGGSRAALQVLNLVRADIHFADMQRAKALINEQLLPAYWYFNVSQSEACPLEFDYLFDETGDVETSARMFQQIASIQLPVKISELYGKLGLTPPSEDDEVIVLKNKGIF